MGLIVKDRVKEATTTTGTSDFTLGGAGAGFQTFAVIGDGNTTYYAAVDQASGDWEVGIGTYSSTGPTLSRDTILESSNSGSKVSFAAGSKDVFCTYPAERSVYLNAAGSAVDVLDIGTLGTSTANITTANITAGTVSTTPSSGNDLVNKTYVDTMVSSGITYHTPVKYEVPNTTGNLNATYNNGTAGVGATLTNAGTLTAFTPDGVVAQVGDRVLIYNQTNAAQNGVYTVTTVGSGSVAWVLTRATDADSYGLKDPNALGEGDAFFISAGNTGAGETYVCNTSGTITFGTTAITFAQVSDATLYTAGTGLTLSGTEFSITPVGTAGTYGGAGTVPVITTNASGQISNVTPTAIAISSAAVSGLAASATTDTTNAANITSGTLPSARLNGSYTGVTGVGTLAAGTWNGSTIAAAYGGTGQSSYTVGDILYADGATSLAKLADVATGNALLSGGVGTAPAWGKVGLQTHISGTLQVANGGTGAATLTGYVYGNGTGAMTASTTIPNAATTATSANTASAIVARDASGNFSAGTITASLSGNATTATTASATTAAITFNNGGAGAASGSTFNGSSAVTISYNTIGAFPASAIPSGTVMLFVQTAAPTGWTKSTTHDNKALRVVSGTASSGGTVAFTTAFASQGVAGSISSTTATNQATTATGSISVTVSAGTLSVGAGTLGTNNTTQGGSVSLSSGGSVSGYTLTVADIPSHTHTINQGYPYSGGGGNYPATDDGASYGSMVSAATGGGGSHSHGFSNPSYSFTGSAHNHSISGSPSLSGSPSVTGQSFTGSAHNHTQDAHSHTFTGTAINLAVQYVDVIIATKA